MKQKTLFIIVMLIAGFAFAQTQSQPAAPAAPATPVTPDKPLAELLGWLVGEWEGEGMSGEQEFVGQMEGSKELDDQAILLRRESSSKTGGVVGGRKELMVIGYEGATKKILLSVNGSNNTLLIYSGELRGQEVVFSLVIPAPQAGYVHRRIFRQLPNGGVSFAIEAGTPEKAPGKTVEINFRKKS